MTEHDVKYYMELPYTIVIRRDDEGDYIARVEELQGCIAHGATPDDALKSLAEAQEGWLGEAISAGQSIPEPLRENALPSGKWVQRVPRNLHRKLISVAQKEGVSLNHFVSTALAEAVGNRAPRMVAMVSAWEEIGKAAHWELIDTGRTRNAVRPLLTELGRATKIQEGSKASGKRSHAKTEKFEYLQ